MFKKNSCPQKNCPQNLLIIGPFFSVVPTIPKPAQFSICVPQKMPNPQLMYNDFFTRLKDCRLTILMAGMTFQRTIFTLAAHQQWLGQTSPMWITVVCILVGKIIILDQNQSFFELCALWLPHQLSLIHVLLLWYLIYQLFSDCS